MPKYQNSALSLTNAHAAIQLQSINSTTVTRWTRGIVWRQMGEMLQNGMQMGSHTIHHVDMGQVLNESVVQAQQELQISQITLQRGFGMPVQQFCYPSGEPFRHGTLAQQQEIVSLLAQDGYIGLPPIQDERVRCKTVQPLLSSCVFVWMGVIRYRNLSRVCRDRTPLSG
jgi:hypothetical protein